MSKYKRVVLDLTPDVAQKLQDLKESIGAKSQTEVVRYALGLLVLTDKYQKDSYVLQFSKDGEVIKVAMPLLS
jgi:CII-binding regulator of phage lambda lysogenization HflD